MQKKNTLSLLNRMTFRSLKKGWAQFLAVILIGAIAVTLFVGLLSNAEVFERQVDKAYREGNLPDLWVTTSRYDIDDEDNLSSMLFERDEIEGRFYLPCQIPGHQVYFAIQENEPTLSKPYGTLEKLNGEDDGCFFYIDKEMKKTETSHALGNFTLGEELSYSFSLASLQNSDAVRTLDDYVLPGKENVFSKSMLTLTSTLTGFMSYPENVTKSAYNSSVVLLSDKAFRKAFQKVLDDNFEPSIHFLIYDSMKKTLGFSSMYSQTLTNPNQYLIRVKNDEKIPYLKESIQYYFNHKDQNNLILTTEKKDMPFYVTLDNDVSQARQFTFVFPFIFFAVAILVILTTLSQMILKERTQIGTMKAIGLNTKEIIWHYISLSLTMVLIGTILGEIIGPLLIPSILGEKYSLLYSLPEKEYIFPILYGILTALAFLSITALVTYLVLRNELRLKPVESMRPLPPKVKLKPTKDTTRKNVFSLSFMMGLRNIYLNKVKSLMVVFGVMGCSALLVCGFGINDTIEHGISHDLTRFRNADITVSLSSLKEKEDVLNDFDSIDGIDKVEFGITSKTNIHKINGPQTSGNIYIIPENSEFIHVEFKKDEVAISQKISRVTKTGVGDTLVFQYNNITYQAKVATVYEAFIYHGIMVHQDASFFKEASSSFKFQNVNIKLKENTDPERIAAELKKLDYVSSADTKKEWQKTIDSALSSVKVMTDAVKVFAILLALVVLYNLSLMNFRERSRDIATLKVLGFSKLEIAMSLLVESLVLTLFGVIFGFLLGFPFLKLVLDTNVVELVEYLVYINPLSFFYSFLLTFIVALVVNLFLVRKTKQIKMVESLKSVE